MLANQNWHSTPTPAPEVDYSGFPHWSVLLAEPNREQRSAECLKRVNVHAYLPQFMKQRRSARARHNHHRMCAMMPGVLLVPVEMLDCSNRVQIMEWAQVRFARIARPLTKAEVEIVREIEARLNIVTPEKTHGFAIGQRVGFLNDLYTAFFGEGTVIEVASGVRIRLMLERKLFGGKDTIWTTAAELEAK